MTEEHSQPPLEPEELTVEVDPLVGRVLNGRFQVVERIGSGGMGRVYRAIQSPLDRAVALKVVIPSYGDGADPNFFKRFFLEASVTSKLQHPNTITIFDYGRTDDGLVYIAMEHLQGRNLSQVIAAEGAQPPARAVHIAAQVARSLREAHELGVIHRDLKPANVMLVKHGEDEWFVKVLDFGLVKFFGGQGEAAPEAQEITREGTFLGSPQYMAPEQAGRNADQRSDVYALGVMLYQMLAGRTPFRGQTIAETILMHLHEPVPPLHGPPDRPIPADLVAIVMKALAKKPADRFQSMAEFLAALKRCSVGEGTGQFSGPVLGLADLAAAPAPTAPVTPPPLQRKMAIQADAAAPGPTDTAETRAVVLEPPRRAPWVAVGAGVMALAAGGVWLWLRQPVPVPAVPAPAPGLGLPEERSPTAASQPARAGALPAQAPVPAPVPAPAPTHAVFHVTSDPEGAQVIENGELLGATPLDLERPLVDGAATVKLRISRFGYFPESVEASSAGEERSLSATLRKMPLKKPQPRPGYKDDPY